MIEPTTYPKIDEFDKTHERIGFIGGEETCESPIWVKEPVDLNEWPPEPEPEMIPEGLDLPLSVVMAPVIAIIICAVLRQLLL